MNIQYLCTRWGSAKLPMAEFIGRVRDAGYDGVEVGLADDDPDADEVLAERPATELMLDVSHWCTVSESLLEDQEDALGSFFSRRQAHPRPGRTRAGTAGVSDPRAPEWQPALQAHLRWWDMVVSARRAAGAKTLTTTPEFGPPPYLSVMPWTQQPVGSQWEINLHMMQLLRAKYA